MGSISTMTGDGGDTSLAGGLRVSKASPRVDAYGTVDELNACLGVARSLCEDAEIGACTKRIQQDLFAVGASLATRPERAQLQDAPLVDVDRLTAEVHRIEGLEGILADWSIPGEHRAAAVFDMARTICRRAERDVVRLREAGDAVDAMIPPFLNRLSDLLWLFGRKLEHDAGLDASLRATTRRPGAPFSRAW